MALKGSATIELTNEDGSKNIIKHDNMITNAPRDLLLARRGEMPPLFQVVNNGDSYTKALFGGILLFSETLNTDADDYSLPSVDIVGYASQDAYSGLDAGRGSCNTSESGLQEDGSYKLVWDFTTNQANGTISSIALCPNIMGQIGASSTIVSSESKNFYTINKPQEPFDTNEYTLPSSGSTGLIENYYYHAVAYIDNLIYAIDEANLYYNSQRSARHYSKNGGKLMLYRFKSGIDNISLNDKVCMSQYVDCVEVQLPTEFTSTLYTGSDHWNVFWSYDYSTSKLSLFPCYIKSNVAVNSTMKYVEVDLRNNHTVSTHTFTNTTGGAIKSYIGNISRNYTSMLNFYVMKDYVVTVSSIDSSTNKVYVVKKSNNTDVKEVTYQNGNTFALTSNFYISPVFVMNDILVFKTSANVTGTSGAYYILDCKTGAIVGTNCGGISSNLNIDIGSKVCAISTKTYLGMRTLVNPFVLTTKNNLDSPVTKTASQTMKITYTLKESEEV